MSGIVCNMPILGGGGLGWIFQENFWCLQPVSAIIAIYDHSFMHTNDRLFNKGHDCKSRIRMQLAGGLISVWYLANYNARNFNKNCKQIMIAVMCIYISFQDLNKKELHRMETQMVLAMLWTCTLNLVPRLHPRGIWWIWTQSLGQGKEFEHSNRIAAIAQSYALLTAGMQQRHCLLYKLNHRPAPVQPCWPIRSEICISTAVLVWILRAGQTKKMVQIHQTLFPHER